MGCGVSTVSPHPYSRSGSKTTLIEGEDHTPTKEDKRKFMFTSLEVVPKRRFSLIPVRLKPIVSKRVSMMEMQLSTLIGLTGLFLHFRFFIFFIQSLGRQFTQEVHAFHFGSKLKKKGAKNAKTVQVRNRKHH
jgi:hypothetical protein